MMTHKNEKNFIFYKNIIKMANFKELKVNS